jgi:hypothetical protein
MERRGSGSRNSRDGACWLRNMAPLATAGALLVSAWHVDGWAERRAAGGRQLGQRCGRAARVFALQQSLQHRAIDVFSNIGSAQFESLHLACRRPLPGRVLEGPRAGLKPRRETARSPPEPVRPAPSCGRQVSASPAAAGHGASVEHCGIPTIVRGERAPQIGGHGSVDATVGLVARAHALGFLSNLLEDV